MSFAPFANVPEGIPKGKITAYVTSFEADGSDPDMSPDDIPDSIPLDGTVTITPRVGTMNWPNLPKPQKSVMSAISCPIIEGTLYRPGTTLDTYQGVSPGVTVVATDQPDALPTTVQYEVRWSLAGARVQPATVTIDVPAGGTVDLATVIPASPEPGTVQVTYTVDRERAEQAALAAEAAAERAENASLGDIDYDLILGRVEPLVGDAVSAGLAGVDDLVASALVPYATTAELTSGLAGKQDAGDYATTADLGAYATTAYVDQVVGDIDTALAGILGGH